MAYLLLASVIWGFSFGLIKAEFSGVSGATLAMARLLIALPCFLVFLKAPFRGFGHATRQLMVIGAVQYGLMYVALFNAFGTLTGYEVALLTVTTPLFVMLANAWTERRWPSHRFWLVALLAVIGALIIFRPSSLPSKWTGIALMQTANLAFAIGQIAYRRWRTHHAATANDLNHFAWLYVGGAGFAALFALWTNPVAELKGLSASQWMALLYLGAIASGVGFFLWNMGAVRVKPASLAVFNNLKIPLAVLVSILVFREGAHYPSLIPGSVILLAALAIAEYRITTRR